jgi:predicted transcriptional regulator
MITQDRYITAMMHPLRASILKRMADNGKPGTSPKELANEFNVPLANVAYHVQVLKKLKMIKINKKEPRRGAVEHFYILTEDIKDARCPTCGHLLEEGS